MAGEKTAFAYSDDISEASLLDAARTVRTIAAAGRTDRVRVAARKIAKSRSLYAGMDPIATLDSAAKVALLGRVEQFARAKDPRVVQVMASLAGEYDVVLVARADGTLAADVRPFGAHVGYGDCRAAGAPRNRFIGGGGRRVWTISTAPVSKKYVNEAVHAALTNLDARPARRGNDCGLAGLAWHPLHEAIGHGLEGDFNRKGSSAFSGRVGQRGGWWRYGAGRRYPV